MDNKTYKTTAFTIDSRITSGFSTVYTLMDEPKMEKLLNLSVGQELKMRQFSIPLSLPAIRNGDRITFYHRTDVELSDKIQHDQYLTVWISKRGYAIPVLEATGARLKYLEEAVNAGKTDELYFRRGNIS